MGFASDGKIGVNVNLVDSSARSDGAGGPQHNLGETVKGTDGQEYVYVQAAETISSTTNEPFALAIDENYQASKLTKALVLAGHAVAWAPEQVIADNAFFWAIKRGSNFNIKVGVSCAADITLYTTATAGVLDDTSGGATANSQVPVVGVVIVTAASTSASARSTVREAIATWPHVSTGV